MVEEEFSNDILLSLFLPVVGGFYMRDRWEGRDEDVSEFLFYTSLLLPAVAGGTAIGVAAVLTLFESATAVTMVVGGFLLLGPPITLLMVVGRQLDGNPYQNLFISLTFLPWSYGVLKGQPAVIRKTWQWYAAKMALLSILLVLLWVLGSPA